MLWVYSVMYSVVYPGIHPSMTSINPPRTALSFGGASLRMCSVGHITVGVPGYVPGYLPEYVPGYDLHSSI